MSPAKGRELREREENTYQTFNYNTRRQKKIELIIR